MEVPDVGAEHRQMPTQSQTGTSRCVGGAEISIGSVDDHVITAHQGMGA